MRAVTSGRGALPSFLRAGAERAVVGWARVERAVAERARAERAVAERARAERAVAERARAERAVFGRACAERPGTERAGTERAGTGRARAERARAELPGQGSSARPLQSPRSRGRRATAAYLRLVTMVCAAALSTAGCEMINDATAPINRDRLIEDMQEQLDRGRNVLYSADYQLAGGYRATVGQQIDPHRTVYDFPGGLLIVNGAQQTHCDTVARPAKCQVNALPSASAGLATGYAEATKHGLITAPVVHDLLRITSLQAAASVKPHDTTIAGQQASCLEISGLVDAPTAAFTACVTADGVLASFTGVVDGVNVDQALIQVNRRVAEDAFSLPVGAQVVDLRPGPSPTPR